VPESNQKQEARHEIQRNIRISFTGQMPEHTEGAVRQQRVLRQPGSTMLTTCFERLNGAAGLWLEKASLPSEHIPVTQQ
jgi:hypothetical protein